MAGDTHEVDLGHDGLMPPWPTLFEVVAATDVSEWILVGGLMVQLHAHRANIRPPRTTKDVDMVVDVITARASVQAVAGQLQAIGFVAQHPLAASSPAHRYLRDKEQIDLMVPDDLPPAFKPRLMRRPVFGAPAGKQAVKRRDTFVVQSGTRTATFGAPDVLGALIAKSAAYEGDQNYRGRHLEDAAVLLASIDAVGQLELGDLSKNDRRHLVRIARMLPDSAAAWRELDDVSRVRGQHQLMRLVTAADLAASGDNLMPE